jgi:uncharacterized protein YbcC (UPF0753/DUF2309 family)
MSVTKEFKYENGNKVTEKVTGFTGIITGTCYYLTGCNQYLVTAKAKDEYSEAKAQWYDEGRLELVIEDKVLTESDVKAESNGCDRVPPGGNRGA